MSQATPEPDEDLPLGSSRRYAVALFIIHPTIDPDEITQQLGLVPQIVHPVGRPRVTPKGTLLGGVYRDTRWRHTILHTTRDQWFVREVEALVARIEPHKDFLFNLKSTGGTVYINIDFMGDEGDFGDAIRTELLSRLAALGIDLGISVYTEAPS